MFETINKMSHFIGCHKKPESVIGQLINPKSMMITTNAALQSKSNQFLREREGCRRERSHQENSFACREGEKWTEDPNR
jgi:hypothetical protein